MQSFIKYLTSVPIMTAVALIVLPGIMIELNRIFPGLQYSTYFHGIP
ncbi:MAG: photosystem I reaction center subunit IX [Cyanobacteria bacterium P01_G01_bin.38]